MSHVVIFSAGILVVYSLALVVSSFIYGFRMARVFEDRGKPFRN